MPQLLPCIVQQCAGTPRQGWNRRIGSEGVEAPGGWQDMAERVEAIRDLGGEDEHSSGYALSLRPRLRAMDGVHVGNT